jgi:chromosome segregation protein
MSRLRELRLHGFKSFADPTRFVFEPGVNAVIGPNGSGKSNMADAVRWVLGEQSNRSLRTRRADDVIFAGSESRKPQGMAEAVLTLDNADGWLPIEFAEVAIGRRAYRSGESDYLINGARARLRDVVELLGEGRLGANELVVVGQGTVDAALSLRPEERRQLFEEAAGVKGLQVKRNEASVRLGRATENLTRVRDLMAELKPQVRRLALQAEHQQQHDALGARARGLVITLHRRREAAARASLGEARRAAAAAEAALAGHREADEQRRAAVAEAESRYWAADEEARTAAAARAATREAVIRADTRLEALTARLAELDRALEADVAELADAERILASTDADAVAEVGPAVAEAAAAEEAWRAAVEALAAADDALLAAEEAVAEVRARESDRIALAARASEEAIRQRTRWERATAEMAATDDAIGTAHEVLEVARHDATRAAQERDAAGAALTSAVRDREQAQAAADDRRHRVLEVEERLRAARVELAAIEEPLDASGRLGRRLVDNGWATLLDALDAPEAAWAAIEAAVGGDLESVLLWADDKDPVGVIGDARGAARLLASPAGIADGRDAALAAVGGSRTLADWIGGARAPAAFHRTVVAADVSALVAGWSRLPDGWTAVTEHGDVADGRGIVTLRGRADPPGGASARTHARRRELGSAIDSLEADLTDAQAAAHEAAERLRAARDAHLAARDRADAAEGAHRAATQAVDGAQGALDRLVERSRVLAAELDEVGAPAHDPEPDAEAGELPRRQEAAAAARARRDELAAERDAARERWTTTRAAAAALETRTADRRRDRGLREARVAQLRAAVPSGRAARERAAEERSEAQRAAEGARTADLEQAERLEAAERARAARRADLVDLERTDTAAAGVAELERAAQATAIEASRLEEGLAGLARERDLALDGLPPTSEQPDFGELEALDDAALDAELRRVRRTLGQIGSVNPFAVEEHREVSARLEEMSTQDDDLRAAIESTEELIARLDADIADRFDAAFAAIGEKFDEYCRLLFAGGSASLQLADEADADAPGGIEIVVRPPGKRLQRLAMLSGGERALTGVALLFAMLTVNPVPFCILDEVDAALDEANIGRFADALRRLAESIDFVVITHNRATIEVADTIYGVTMTDAAVSRVLSLRLADVPVEATA